MLKRFVSNHPYWSYYVLAVAFPSFLMIYLTILEIYGQSVHGSEFSFLGNFYTIRDSLIADFPALFHHEDSWVLYVSGMFLMPLGFPFFFFPAAPTTAALIITALGRGKQAVKALISLYKPIQGSLSVREGVRIYAALLAGICLMLVVTCLREYFFGDPTRVAGYLEHNGVINWQIFLGTWVMALFFNQGAALEELGWRGYALPMLIRRFGSPLGATLLLGVCWALWHFPREVPPLLAGQQQIAELLISQAWFILSCCSMSVVATYFVNITGGSVLPAIIIHGSLNQIGAMFASEQVGMRVSMQADSPLMWFCAALVILLLAGRDLGWQRRLELLGDSDPSDLWVNKDNRI